MRRGNTDKDDCQASQIVSQLTTTSCEVWGEEDGGKKNTNKINFINYLGIKNIKTTCLSCTFLGVQLHEWQRVEKGEGVYVFHWALSLRRTYSRASWWYPEFHIPEERGRRNENVTVYQNASLHNGWIQFEVFPKWNKKKKKRMGTFSLRELLGQRLGFLCSGNWPRGLGLNLEYQFHTQTGAASGGINSVVLSRPAMWLQWRARAQIKWTD